MQCTFTIIKFLKIQENDAILRYIKKILWAEATWTTYAREVVIRTPYSDNNICLQKEKVLNKNVFGKSIYPKFSS